MKLAIFVLAFPILTIKYCTAMNSITNYPYQQGQYYPLSTNNIVYQNTQQQNKRQPTRYQRRMADFYNSDSESSTGSDTDTSSNSYRRSSPKAYDYRLEYGYRF